MKQKVVDAEKSVDPIFRISGGEIPEKPGMEKEESEKSLESKDDVETHKHLTIETGGFTLGDEDAEETNWRLIYITAVVSFLGAIEGAAVHMSEWPYMRQIDPDATVKFFGLASSASKAAHAVFVLVFAVWSFKYKTIKWPLIAGRVIAIIACVLYLCIEFVPTGRRYMMMFCYILFDVSGSSPSILRAYIAAVSLPKDRSKAFAAMSLSMTLSIIMGPLIQMAFTTIPYPGFTIIPHVKFHVYSAPIWIANSTNFISIAIIVFGMKELPRKPKTKKPKKPSILEWEGLKMRIEKVKRANIDWILVFVVWIAKCGKSMTARSIGTLLPILLMVQYGWTGIETVRITSILMGGSGILSMFVIGSFMFCKLGTIVQPRFIYLFSITLFVGLYIVTYPYKSIGVEVAMYNGTDGSGCDPEKYTWCEGGIAPQPVVFLSCMVFVFGMTMPSSGISLDTIYSKILGNIDQAILTIYEPTKFHQRNTVTLLIATLDVIILIHSVMQGAAVILDDIVMVITPTYASYIYTLLGLKPLWIMNGIIMSLVVFLWIAMIRKFKPYS